MMTTNDDTNEKATGLWKRVNWDDPAIPAGDSPPLPWWPLALSVVIWGGCVIVLIALARMGQL